MIINIIVIVGVVVVDVLQAYASGKGLVTEFLCCVFKVFLEVIAGIMTYLGFAS
jgi:hypothetical protein